MTTLNDSDGPLLKVDGHLDPETLPEFRRLCDGWEGPLRLDLSDLLDATPAALGVLRELKSGGAELKSVRPFLRMLIEGSV